MNNDKTTKKLIIIIFILLALIGSGIFYLKTMPVFPNFIGMGKDEVLKWTKENGYEGIKFEFIEDENFTEGKVIKQSFGEGEIIQSGLVIYLATGKNKTEVLELPNPLTYDILISWAKENNVELSFVENEKETDEIEIIKISPEKEIIKGCKLTVEITKKKESKNTYTPLTKEKVEKSKVYIDDSYLGKNENEFLIYIKEKGLVPRETEPCYSFTIKEGTLWDYSTGEFTEGDIITYTLSRGPYSFNKKDYENKTKNQIEEFAEDLNDLNAHIYTSYSEEYSETVKRGTAISCSWTTSDYKNYISCILSKGHKDIKDDNTDNSDPDEEIIEFTCPANSTKNSLGECICNEGYKDNGQGKCIEDKPLTSYLPAMNIFESMIFNSADDAENYLKNNTLKDFTNVTYHKETTRDYLTGSIYEITLNGDSGYNPSYYELSSDIDVYISKGY